MLPSAMPPAIIPPATLLSAYAQGIFPMADDREDESVYWVEPRRRAILPLDGFHLSRSLAKVVRGDRFGVTSDRAFAAVVRECAAPAAMRETTWINRTIEDSYAALHRIGHAHSVECWQDDVLVGGLYGVSLGRAFFGESMFSRATDASKVALAWLVARLRAGGFTLLDCQFMTAHLERMGAIEIRQSDYLALLQPAVSSAFAGGAAAGAAGAGAAAGAEGAATAAGDWGALDALLAAGAAGAAGAVPSRTSTSPGQLIVQLLTNTS
jgi:leucyl/phenylalanyl-tRNA---protein transferase